MEKYYYKIYGLKIKSEVKMEELTVIDKDINENIDVNITYGIIPKDIIGKIEKGYLCHMERKFLVFCIPNVAKYYVSYGKNIIIEVEKNADEQKVKTFLLGTSFGMLLYQRDTVAIHGGAIVLNEKVMVITGNQGAGKSTLTNAFRSNGCKFMADDVSVVTVKEEKILIESAYGQQKLCKDTMEKLNFNKNNFNLIDEGREKFLISVKDNFQSKALDLGVICLLEVSDTDKVFLEEIKGCKKLEIFLDNIYRMEIFGCIGLSKEYLKKCLNIVENIPMFKIIRPKDKFTINEQINLIKELKYR
ncbi:hypothetical protein [Clostridium tarantellae]|uniref:HPr kinase/phosphorylase C-terminal domain-containing protein n=1 Tax=Clostridium tarantellae TaxID=39493 RepID=A0A6I1MRZ8_9CLOT|nr:hypothetical protein [Clostridium tarantellae]MPQ43661.1 hypothetical protein [Clostridium tarantellae]